jgi:hypothetical protein
VSFRIIWQRKDNTGLRHRQKLSEVEANRRAETVKYEPQGILKLGEGRGDPRQQRRTIFRFRVMGEWARDGRCEPNQGELSRAEGKGLRVPCDFKVLLMDMSKRCIEGARESL